MTSRRSGLLQKCLNCFMLAGQDFTIDMMKRLPLQDPRRVHCQWLLSLAAMFFVSAVASFSPLAAAESEDADDQPPAIRVAQLVYDGGKTSQCFANRFLVDFTRETEIKVRPELVKVPLASHELFDHPMVVFTGEEKFALNEEERDNLRAYMQGGGFVIASAGCSNPNWQDSFTSLMGDLLPDAEFKPLPMDHPLFTTVYEIRSLKNKRRWAAKPLEGVYVDDRLVLVYGPEGLNDTRNAGGDCCCCGGNELLNARLINVNLLAYALTH